MDNYRFRFQSMKKADKFEYILDQTGVDYIRQSRLDFVVYGILPETYKVLLGFA